MAASSHLSLHPIPLLVKIHWFHDFKQVAAALVFYVSENVTRTWQLFFALLFSKEKDWEDFRDNPILGQPLAPTSSTLPWKGQAK